jgi:hypothetical protein
MESHTKLGAGGSKGVYELDDEVTKIPYDCSLARVGPDILNANIDMYEDVGIPYAETHIDDLPDNFSSDEDLRDFAFYQDKADRTPDDLETDAEIDRWLGEIVNMAEDALEHGYYLDIMDINNFGEFNGEIRMLDVADSASIRDADNFGTNSFDYRQLAEETARTTGIPRERALLYIHRHSNHSNWPDDDSYW